MYGWAIIYFSFCCDIHRMNIVTAVTTFPQIPTQKFSVQMEEPPMRPTPHLHVNVQQASLGGSVKLEVCSATKKVCGFRLDSSKSGLPSWMQIHLQNVVLLSCVRMVAFAQN